ncbi:MAG: murein transglycosylase domain-containing protein [Thiomicrorhabdus chilensis]|uniref:murein transglycosylase domain-containing protein n=1 Tax=Thiomicrorhabdus chilensis TaxID=63656 RepID=UPI00299E4099|nr:murein transglycosylase domain-containing protein [Thiomicrorhabdus chilensis]MDX1346901.1 murein transglycosylase domain-containing protein [Thiomicrorhabdus chilensis]
MKNSLSWFSAVFASLLLLLVAGGAFSGFQEWMKYRVKAPDPLSQGTLALGGIDSMGIRGIVSSESMGPNEFDQETKPVNLLTETSALSLTEVTQVSNRTKRESQNTLSDATSDRPVEIETSGLKASPQAEGVSPPTVIVYDDELVVEFAASGLSNQMLKRALSRLLLSDAPFTENLLSTDTIRFRKRPYFYKRVLDQSQKPIRYPANAFEYVDYLLASDHINKVTDEEGEFLVVHIPLVSRDYPQPVQRYQQWVETYAKQFEIEPSLVFAVMETESGFKPDAVSRSQALGLMQLKPHTAGKDVYKHIDFKQGMPNKTDLFDEQNNIRMGTAYLGLLNNDYLSGVRNPENKELLTIASYNGGLSTVLKLFGETSQSAIQRINRLHPRQVYRKLRFEHDSDETRRYLDKVLRAKSKYEQILDV